MTTKTERVTFLATPDFKEFITTEASKEGVSVSELIRDRMSGEAQIDPDEEVLAALILQVGDATRRANKSLDKGLKAANATLRALRKQRAA